MKVLAVRHGLFWDRVKCAGDTAEEAVFDSFMGPRVFYSRPGMALTFRVSRRAMIEAGESLPIHRAVKVAADWTSLPWRWR